MIQLLITLKCNFRCGHCMYCCSESGRHMSHAVFSKALRYVEEAGGVHVMGGEPTLHPDFNNLLPYLVDTAKKIRIVTNGSTLLVAPSHEIRSIAEASEKVGRENFMVRVSNDAWHRKFISEENIFKANSNLVDAGVDSVCDDLMVPSYPIGRASLLPEARVNDGQPAECSKGEYDVMDNLSIDVDGYVSPCPHHQAVIGNILQLPMPEIIDRCKEFVRRVRKAGPTHCSCRICSSLV